MFLFTFTTEAYLRSSSYLYYTQQMPGLKYRVLMLSVFLFVT